MAERMDLYTCNAEAVLMVMGLPVALKIITASE